MHGIAWAEMRCSVSASDRSSKSFYRHIQTKIGGDILNEISTRARAGKGQSWEQDQKDSKLIEFNNFDQLTDESAEEFKGLREKMIFMMKHEQKVPGHRPSLTYISFCKCRYVICRHRIKNLVKFLKTWPEQLIPRRIG